MSVSLSEELLARHGSAIGMLAHSLRVSSGGVVRHRDLVVHGVTGMLEAAGRFDPEQGVQFWSFAYTRVRGAMMDAIRVAMPLRRGLHRRLIDAEAAYRSIAVGTTAHDQAAERLAEAKEALGLLRPSGLGIVSGEALGEGDDDDARALPHASDRFSAGVGVRADDRSADVVRVDQPGADEQLELAVRAAAIHEAMKQLSVAERMIVRGLYFEDRCLTDLGGDLGISKSWASRIHSRGLARLREILEDDWGYDAEELALDEACNEPPDEEPEAEAA
jgi:RNA polymerase sigma factor FliA